MITSSASKQNFQECRDAFLVCALQLDGRGDIYGAHEIALRIQKLMPHAKVTFTVLKPRFRNEFEASLFADIEYVDIAEIEKQENWTIEKEECALKAASTFKRIIVYPTYHDTMLPKEILNFNDNVIKLREYSVGKPTFGTVKGPTYTLGLAKDQGEKGVLLPMEFSQNLPPYRETTPLVRLSHLKKVDPALCKAILGKEFSDEAIQEFNKTSKLYLGYFSQAGMFFCFINALLRCKKGKISILNTQKRPDNLLPEIQKTLWKSGFGSIRIIEFSNYTDFTVQNHKFKTNNPKSRECTIIFRPLFGVEMEAMLDASEEESLVTGDLSPFRFLAHRKTIAYDTRVQKHESAKAIIELAATFDPLFKDLLPYAFFGAEEPTEICDSLEIQDGMIAFFMAMEDPSLKANWNLFIDEVFAKYDFAPEMEKILQERM